MKNSIHKSVKYFTIEMQHKTLIVNKSIHSYKGRCEDSLTSRDMDLLKGDYKDIVKLSIRYGLLSFGNSSIVVNFKDWRDRDYYILITRQDNILTIISTLRLTNGKVGYLDIRNRINISKHYILQDTYNHKVIRLSNSNGLSIKRSNITLPKVRKVKKSNPKIDIKPKAKDMTVDEFWDYSNEIE